jgi:hypothetical protein
LRVRADRAQKHQQYQWYFKNDHRDEFSLFLFGASLHVELAIIRADGNTYRTTSEFAPNLSEFVDV